MLIFSSFVKVRLGIHAKLVELCDVFFPNGVHSNCCFSTLSFDEKARNLTKSLIEGKKLIGKIDPGQSSGTRSKGK